MLCFSTIYMISIIGSSQAPKVFSKYNHLQPPDAAAFCHVDVIISWVIYFSMKVMCSLHTKIFTKMYKDHLPA